MGKIIASAAYFIKLGRKGEWEEECILHKNTIKFGFNNPLHLECLSGNWDQVREYWLKQGKKKGKATEITNQIRTFYESDDNTLWITFFNRKLYWCFAEKEITEHADGARTRKVKGKWSCQDIAGNELEIDSLSGKLTQVRRFQGTICTVKELEYLIRKVNYQKLPEVQKAEDSLVTLLKDIEPLIQNLNWKDFELLVDLIFTQSGWQRISTLGKTEKSIDLAMISPVTGNQAFIQVKSKSTWNELQKYIEKYRDMPEYNKMFFVVHTREPSLNTWQDTPDIKLFDVKRLSKLVINSGLVDWLIKKTS